MPEEFVNRVYFVDGRTTHGSRGPMEDPRFGSRRYPDAITALKSVFHAARRPSWAIILLAGMAGCGPKLGDEELGRIEYRLPQIPGAEAPYPLPDLTVIQEKEGAAEEEKKGTPAEEKKAIPEDEKQAASKTQKQEKTEETKKGSSEGSTESLLEKGKEPLVEEADEASLDGSDS